MTPSGRPRVYLAGPEVFLPDAVGQGEKKKALCAEYGFDGVFPLDGAYTVSSPPTEEEGLAIARGNEELIRGSDLLIANLTPFRGPSADVGTVYEVGFARAVGLPVYGYTNELPDFLARTASATGALPDAEGVVRDGDGMALEDFGLVDNLMVDGGVRAAGQGIVVVPGVPRNERFTDLKGFAACLRGAQQRFGLAPCRT